MSTLNEPFQRSLPSSQQVISAGKPTLTFIQKYAVGDASYHMLAIVTTRMILHVLGRGGILNLNQIQGERNWLAAPLVANTLWL